MLLVSSIRSGNGRTPRRTTGSKVGLKHIQKLVPSVNRESRKMAVAIVRSSINIPENASLVISNAGCRHDLPQMSLRILLDVRCRYE
jgi:hypothetical protein